MIKDSLVYTIGNLLPQLGGFIFLPIYLKYMSVEDFGIVSSMLVIQSIVSIFFSLALERSVMRLYFDYESSEQKGIFFGTTFMSIIILSSFLCVLLILFNGILANIFPDISFYPYYLYAILIAYAKCFFFIPKTYLQVNQKSIQYVLLSFSEFIVVSLAVLFYVVYNDEGPAGMLKGQLLGTILLIPFLFSIVRKKFIFRFDFSVLKKSLRFSLPIVPTLLTAFVLNLSDRIFLDRYMGLTEVGLYSLAYKIAAISLIAISAINMAITPHYFQKLKERGFLSASDWSKKFNNNFVKIIGVLVFVLLLFSKEIILILFGSNYSKSISIIGILLLAYYFAGTNSVNGRLIQYQKKTHHSMGIDIFTALVNIGLNFLLIPKYGMTGAALATLASLIFAFGINFIYVRLHLGVSSVSFRVYLFTVSILVVAILLNSIEYDEFLLFFIFKVVIFFIIVIKNFNKLKTLLK